MRIFRRLAGSLSLLFFIGCAAEPAAGLDVDERSPIVPRRGSIEEPNAPGPIDVRGLVADERGGPIGGRAVRLVDAAGERRESLTEDDGSFAFDGVRAPYDLGVAAPLGGPTAYLGLTRADPWLELAEREAAPAPPERQIVRAVVEMRPCGLRPDWITVVTASPSGGGSATIPVRAGDANPVIVEVEHGWYAAPPPGEVVRVHVLAGDEDRSSFAYAAADRVPAAPGERTRTGPIAPASIHATEPLALGAEGGEGALVEWRWTTEASLDLAGGGQVTFAAAEAASLTARLPLVPGASVRVSVAAVDPHAEPRRGYHRSTGAWSGARPLSPERDLSRDAGSLALEVRAGPESLQPAVGEILSREAIGFAWKRDDVPALVTVTVADVTRGVVRFRALTTDEQLPHARLAALGLATVLPGEHLLELTTAPLSTTDEATSLDASTRRRRFDRARPGAATQLRIPFHVAR